MIALALFGIFSVVVVLILFLQYVKERSDATATPQRPAVANQVILAMSQRNVYGLAANPDAKYSDEIKQWARRLIDHSCSVLDDWAPNVVKLKLCVNGYCDRVEHAVKDYEVHLLEHGKRLAAIIDAQRSIEKELKALSGERHDDEKKCKLGSAPQGHSGNARPALPNTTIAILKDDEECFMDAFSQVVSTHEDEDVSDEEE